MSNKNFCDLKKQKDAGGANGEGMRRQSAVAEETSSDDKTNVSRYIQCDFV